MPRSQDFLRSAFAQETEEVWLALLTISHADLSEDIRVVNNKLNITSRGLMFTGFAFDFVPPFQSSERQPRAELVIDGVSTEIAQHIRSISSAPGAKFEFIRAADPDTVEQTFDGFLLRDVRWDVESVTGTLSLEDIAREPYPAGIFSPASFPGLT